MSTFNDIAKLMEKSDFSGGVSEEKISSAEDELGVKFPPSFRKFLASYGAALCPGFEVGGLIPQTQDDEPPLWTDIVTATRQKRRSSRGLIPNEYIPISDDGGDYTFYLDTSRQGLNGECPVIALGPGVDDAIIADTFFDFVVRSFDGTISFK